MPTKRDLSKTFNQVRGRFTFSYGHASVLCASGVWTSTLINGVGGTNMLGMVVTAAFATTAATIGLIACGVALGASVIWDQTKTTTYARGSEIMSKETLDEQKKLYQGFLNEKRWGKPSAENAAKYKAKLQKLNEFEKVSLTRGQESNLVKSWGKTCRLKSSAPGTADTKRREKYKQKLARQAQFRADILSSKNIKIVSQK